MSPLNPLLRLQHLETSSPRFPTEIATILEGEEYKSSVKTLQDRDSAWLADYLDNACPPIISIPSMLNFSVGPWDI